MIKWIYFVVTCCLLSSCGIIEGVATNQSKREFSTEAQAQHFFNTSTIDCNSQDCPENVGGLYTFTTKSETSYNVGSCSLTLIDSNRVITNRHCLPDDIETSGSLCKKRIKILFPQNKDFSFESYDCKQVVKASVHYPNVGGPDWAVIEFEGSTKRKPIKKKLSGIALNQDVLLYPVYFDLNASGYSRGTIRQVVCKANSNFYFSDDFISPWSALFNIAYCNRQMITGNSGTGLQNFNGELIGVYAFGMKDNVLAEYKKDYPRLQDNFGGGTNLFCIPFINKNVSSHCSYDYQSDTYRDLTYLSQVAREMENKPQFRGLGDEILNSLTSHPFIEFTTSTKDLLPHFLIQSYPENSFEKAKDYVTANWLQNLFPAIPQCIHKDKVNGETSFDWPIRALTRNGHLVDPVYLYSSRATHIQNEEFKLIKKEDHFIAQATSPILWDDGLKKLFRINTWQEFTYKIDFCPE